MQQYLADFKWYFIPIYLLILTELCIMGWEVLKFLVFIFGKNKNKK